MADKKIDFDPMTRAESLVAQAMESRQHGDGSWTHSVPAERREQIRDLLLFSQAQSLKRIADTLDGTTLGISISDTLFNTKR